MYDCIRRLDWLHEGFTNLEVTGQTVEGLCPICKVSLQGMYIGVVQGRCIYVEYFVAKTKQLLYYMTSGYSRTACKYYSFALWKSHRETGRELSDKAVVVIRYIRDSVSKEQQGVRFMVPITGFTIPKRSFPALAYETLISLALLSTDMHGVLDAEYSNDARTPGMPKAEELDNSYRYWYIHSCLSFRLNYSMSLRLGS